jgi:CBS domain-containing protein
VHVALATMGQVRVRRLPVVGRDNTLVGMLSMNDLLLASGSDPSVRTEDIVQTLQAICGHRQPASGLAAA